jgi:hypothetical protein
VSSCGRRREQHSRTRKDKQGSAPDCARCAGYPMTIRGGGNPHTAMAAMPLGEWTRRLGALPAEAYDCFMVETPHVGSTEYKRGSRDCSRPMAGSPRIIAQRITRSRAACRRARVRQGQAYGGAEEAQPPLRATATVICGRDGRMLAARVEQKNEVTKHDKNGGDALLTEKAPYKPYAGKPHVRFCAGGVR